MLINGVKYNRVDDINSLKSFLSKGSFIKSGLSVPVEEIVLHWAGSSYTGYSDHYQINVCLDTKTNKTFLLVADKSNFFDSSIHSHTWKRNTGKIGLSYICMFDIKRFPVTNEMIELAGQACAVICDFFGITTKDIKDHEDYAIIDDYRGLRWDCELKLNNGETVSSRTIRLASEYLSKINNKPVQVVKKTVEKPKELTPTVFKDVFKEKWYSVSILDLYSKGIVKGSKGLFLPEDSITRLHTCYILNTFINYIESNNRVVFENKINIQTTYGLGIDRIIKLGLMTGYKDNAFYPDNNLTRAEMSAIFSNLKKLIETKIKLKPINRLDENFLDVNNEWFAQPVKDCISMSLFVGYKESTGHYFRPNDLVKRSEFAVALYKFIRFLEKNKND